VNDPGRVGDPTHDEHIVVDSERVEIDFRVGGRSIRCEFVRQLLAA
jgi:hypothetical protein